MPGFYFCCMFVFVLVSVTIVVDDMLLSYSILIKMEPPDFMSGYTFPANNIFFVLGLLFIYIMLVPLIFFVYRWGKSGSGIAPAARGSGTCIVPGRRRRRKQD